MYISPILSTTYQKVLPPGGSKIMERTIILLHQGDKVNLYEKKPPTPNDFCVKLKYYFNHYIYYQLNRLIRYFFIWTFTATMKSFPLQQNFL